MISCIWDLQIFLTYLFCMGKKMVSHITSETCEALYEVLCNKYLNPPKTRSNGKRYLMTLKSYGSFLMLLEQLLGSTFVFRLQIKVELCFIITKDFSAFNYLRFVMLSTILYLLMLDNMDLTMIVLFLQICKFKHLLCCWRKCTRHTQGWQNWRYQKGYALLFTGRQNISIEYLVDETIPRWSSRGWANLQLSAF